MRRFDRTTRRRMVLLIIIVIVHVLLGYLVIHVDRFRTSLPPDRLTEITFLPPSRPRPSTEHRSPTESMQRLTDHTSKRATDQPKTTEPSNAVATPNINWNAEAEAATRRQTDNEEMEQRRKNLAGPSDAQLDWARNNAPLIRPHPEAGDTERAEGGQVITWVSDKCHWTTASAPWMSQTTKICKDPPKPEDEIFKDMRKERDDRERERLP